MTSSTTVIQCLCGGIQLALAGAPLACLYCHCDDCQAVHGAAYLPAAIYKMDQTRLVAGSPVPWKRKTTTRAFCRDCGTRIYAEPDGLGVRTVCASLLPPGVFQPSFHMQCRYAVAPVKDDLPHYRAEAPLFGGSGEQMAW